MTPATFPVPSKGVSPMLPSRKLPKAAFSGPGIPSILSLLLSLGLATATVHAQVVAPTLSVTPNPAPGGKTFTLTLLGTTSNCNTFFSRESVTVSGTRIDLSYTANSYIVDPPYPVKGSPGPVDPICPVFAQGNADANIIPPYYSAPTFAMPALKAGE